MQSAAVHFVLEHWPTMDSGQRLHMDNKRAPGTTGANGQFAHGNMPGLVVQPTWCL